MSKFAPHGATLRRKIPDYRVSYACTHNQCYACAKLDCPHSCHNEEPTASNPTAKIGPKGVK